MKDKSNLYDLKSRKNLRGDKSMSDFYDDITRDVLARTLWGEARGEGARGMIGVANVVLNRVKVAQEKGKFWWGNNIIQVCQKPYQFSCWNRSDPNFKKLQNIGIEDKHFAKAMEIAGLAIAEQLEDLTRGSTHYHAKEIKPYWSRAKEPIAVIGSHIFYRLVD